MKRRNGSGKFNRRDTAGEDINPLDGVANLADVMLVFACGLMLALITYWNVDVATTVAPAVDVPPGQEITEDLSGADSSDDSPDQDGLEEYGKVYRDPVSGKLYIVAEGDE